jgi:hypothetical protein
MRCFCSECGIAFPNTHDKNTRCFLNGVWSASLTSLSVRRCCWLQMNPKQMSTSLSLTLITSKNESHYRLTVGRSVLYGWWQNFRSLVNLVVCGWWHDFCLASLVLWGWWPELSGQSCYVGLTTRFLPKFWIMLSTALERPLWREQSDCPLS